MKIGIGIDTGGTCTDAVVYHLERKEILAYAKTLTTKDDLSVGIGLALDGLPRELVDQSEVIALSTTLATNACVENKGGRAKLVLFGVDPGLIAKIGAEYGLPVDNQTLIYIDSKTKPTGEIIRPPDWAEFETSLQERLSDCDAVGIVELFAKRTGAILEKQARSMIQQHLNIPIVCGHELFSEYNVAKRGASALLNAQLIPVIQEFLQAVKKALQIRGIRAPFVIVRSDGSLMTEAFTRERPVETLLCGPVASVMGAVELSDVDNCMIVDIGGTTTDIAFVKNRVPQRATGGVRIGKWDTFVQGLFVDTFGLGGDSGVRIVGDGLELEAERVMPLCVAGQRYPQLLSYLHREAENGYRFTNTQKDIYVAIKSIAGSAFYSQYEQEIATALDGSPKSLEHLGEELGHFISPTHVERLVREGILIRCGVTPTDAMHTKGTFTQYNTQASKYGMQIMSRVLGVSVDALGDMIYDAVKRKLYFNIVRILMEDAYPSIRAMGLGEQLSTLIMDSYDQAKTGQCRAFCGVNIRMPAALVGVGAPTHTFLQDMGALLETPVYTSEYSKVANALGAIVGNVSASVTMEVTLDPKTGIYTVFGQGVRCEAEELEEAKAMADRLASEMALKEAILRGSDEQAVVTLESKEDVTNTDFGFVYIGYTVVATATGNLKLNVEE